MRKTALALALAVYGTACAQAAVRLTGATRAAPAAAARAVPSLPQLAPISAAAPAPGAAPVIIVPSRESMLCPSPYGAMSEIHYQAAILHEPTAMGQLLAHMALGRNYASGNLQSLYLGIASIYDGDAPASERTLAATAALTRYDAFLEMAERHPDLPSWLKKKISRMREPLVRDGAAVHGMAWARQELAALAQTDKLLTKAKRARAKVPAPATSPASAAGRRSRKDDTSIESENVEISTMREERDIRRSLEFALEKALARLQAGRRLGASKRLLARLEAQLALSAEELRSIMPELRALAAYWRDATYAMAFAAHKPGRILAMPPNRGLKLIAEPGGWRVEASFETDVRAPARRRAVKAAIEEYWRGTFSWRGERVRLRVVVDIMPIPKNSDFSGRRLILKDAGAATSMAGRDTIYLGRNADYMVPAHEFGHILGLDDDYSSRLLPERFAREVRSTPGSIMGDRAGVVQERHLRRAYLLLRRRRDSDIPR